MKEDVELIDNGTTRLIVIVSDKVVKVARNLRGIAANRYEFELWHCSSESRRSMLCPAIAVFCGCKYLVAKRADQLTEEEFERLWKSGGLPDWDYHPQQDNFVGDPTECKAEDWGRLDGRIVRIDYANVPIVIDTPV